MKPDDIFNLACNLTRIQAYNVTGDESHLKAITPMREVDEDVAHDEAVQREVDMGMEMSDAAASMLYRAARLALMRGNLDAITEHSLREAVKAAEAL